MEEEEEEDIDVITTNVVIIEEAIIRIRENMASFAPDKAKFETAALHLATLDKTLCRIHMILDPFPALAQQQESN
jgi:hypothetical protein